MIVSDGAALRRFVIVTGLSGAGKSQAMKSFEDYGFTCLDNLPPTLMRRYIELAREAGVERIAVALDVRTSGPFGDALAEIDDVIHAGYAPQILFLDAADDAIVRRYSETRRKHPLAAQAGSIGAAIALERQVLAPLRERASVVWETTTLTHGMLKMRVGETFVDDADALRMRVAIVAFGFKHGLPAEADIVFDVRFLPNPNYVPDLRAQTGEDAPVAEYLQAIPETEAFFFHVCGLLDFVIPQYRQEGKSHLTIAVGCTGGRHRSVYLARRLESHLRADRDLLVSRTNRDLA